MTFLHLDKSETDHSEKNYRGKTLKRHNFKNRDLRKADFSEARLQNANFSGAKLQGADFSGAKLQGADFSNAELQGARFKLAVLRGACFDEAITHRADFSKTQIGRVAWISSFIRLFLLLLSVISGYFIGKGSDLTADFIFADSSIRVLLGLVSLVLLLFIVMMPHMQRLNSVSILTITGVVSFIFQALSGDVNLAFTFEIIGFISFSEAISVICSVGITPTLKKSVLFVSIAVSSLSAVFIIWHSSGLTSGLEDTEEFVTTIFIAVAITTVGRYVGIASLSGNPNYTTLKKVSIFFARNFSTSFRGADLTDASFQGATFESADFRNTKRKETTISRTRFFQCRGLDYIEPGNTPLRDSKIRKLIVGAFEKGQPLDLSNAHLEELNLSNMVIEHVNLRGAYLIGANLTSATLNHMDLSKVKLDEAQLQGASLEGTILTGARLNGANLKFANLKESKLKRAILRNTNLEGANLYKTDFDEANLRGATLTGACIRDWNINGSTLLDNVNCDYIFTDLEKNNSFRRPRTPSKFGPGEFVKFVSRLTAFKEKLYGENIKSYTTSESVSIVPEENFKPGNIAHGIEANEHIDKAAVEVFIVYASQDREFYDDLETHLKRFENDGIIELCHIRGGDSLPHRGIQSAQIVLLLISSKFEGSDICKVHLARALERHEIEGISLIPILVRPYAWEQSWLRQFVVLPSNQKAVSEYSIRDVAMKEIATAIGEIAIQLRESR